MQEKQRGIRRHDALKPLSRHHTNALHMGLKLRRANTEKSNLTVPELKADLKAFWFTSGQEHFREEEEILLTAFAQHASIDRPEIKDMLLEHVKIRALIDSILTTDEDMISQMHELGELLDVHIRKEERIIFPLIEKSLPEDKLLALAPYFHE